MGELNFSLQHVFRKVETFIFRVIRKEEGYASKGTYKIVLIEFGVLLYPITSLCGVI